MTHKTVEFTIKSYWVGSGSYKVESFNTPDAELFFRKGAPFAHPLLKKALHSERYTVRARVNTASRTKRRYILSVTPIVVETETSPAVETAFEGAVKVGGAPIGQEEPKRRNDGVRFHVTPEHAEIFNTATVMHMTDPEKPVRILMVGPSGYGKTSLPRHYADAKGLNYFRMNCASVRDPEEWFGYRVARDGSTFFEPSDFVKTVQKGNAVVVLDEFNRLEQWLSNTLYPLLDDDASTTIYNQEFKVGPNVVFVMTINLGYQYTGTFVLDAALTNRVDMFCKVGPLPIDVEMNILMNVCGIKPEDAQAIVSMAHDIRSLELVECSTRTTLQLARMVAAGASVRTAFQHVVIGRCLADQSLQDSVKTVIDKINSKLGTYRAPKTNGFL